MYDMAQIPRPSDAPAIQPSANRATEKPTTSTASAKVTMSGIRFQRTD